MQIISSGQLGGGSSTLINALLPLHTPLGTRVECSKDTPQIETYNFLYLENVT